MFYIQKYCGDFRQCRFEVIYCSTIIIIYFKGEMGDVKFDLNDLFGLSFEIKN